LISVEQARSGHPVLKKRGRFLGSSFDPLKEASSWADRIDNGLGARDFVIVLGLGCGYHVAELCGRLGAERVVVIENDTELVAQVLGIFPELVKARIIVETDWLNLAANDAFRDALANVFRIAIHGPSCQIEPEYFRSVERLLIGRDKVSFLLQLKARPDIWTLLDPQKVAAVPDEVISIKTLQSLFADTGAASRERRMWRVLEELVV
jgi:hypothetical protein